MKMEKEITVKVNTSYDALIIELKKNGFKLKEEFLTKDIYLVHGDVDLYRDNPLEILKKCVIIRDISNIKKELLYKYKEYAANGDIIKQGKIECFIEDTSTALKFMEAINYKVLFEIYDKCYYYANNKTEVLVQYVNDQHLFIEMEDEARHIDCKYETIEEMINDLDSYHLSYDKSDYFVKKALITLNETLTIK